jgi:outer membrane immunogenic protein
MKKLSFATLGLAALVAAPAMAADLPKPVYKAPPPPPPIPIFTWTGCYIGGNVGGLWVNKTFTAQTAPFLGQSFSSNASSAVGGLQGGCNYQFAGGWVVGIQGDYDWTNAHATRTGVLAANFTDSFSARSVGSVTGRVGYAWNRFLPYVKGGAAWERDNLTFTFPTVAATLSDTRSGWTVGVGGEYAFTNWLTGFVEYDYYNFGTRSNNFACGAVACFVGGPTLFPLSVKESKNVVKVGLNFLFGPGIGPVGGRY